MTKTLGKLCLFTLLTTACYAQERSLEAQDGSRAAAPAVSEGETKPQLATFAGGCFWCVEAPFEKVPGVLAVVSGYTGGQVENPTYAQVSRGGTGHTEAVQVKFDPSIVTYDDLLQVFWRQIDPTDAGGQFVDRGSQYRSEIFFHDALQKAAAEKSKRELGESKRYDRPLVTPVTALAKFYDAEPKHQDYYKKNPADYHRYRNGSGRDKYLERVWGADRIYTPASQSGAAWRTYKKLPDEELRARLTKLQYQVTQEDSTERPFRNEYWDNHAAGIYVDVVSGEPLFSSLDKFESGTGWPSFTRPLLAENIARDVDHKLGYARDEVRSAKANSHLGHVFKDGPRPTGLRYCINSAALRFVPREELAIKGYGEFLPAFEAKPDAK